MSDNQEMTSEQKKSIRKQNNRNFRRFWVIYVGLFGTALLSFVSGLILPFMRNDVVVPLTWGTAFVALYYGCGFLVNGELMANFWFGKITDQDPDNTIQKIIAWGMLAVSIIIISATCISAADMIAFWVGVFNQFYQIPIWVQKYVVYAIPVMLVSNVVMAMLFRGISDEAIAEREAMARINQAMSNAAEAEAKAEADYIIANAPALARERGQLKAAAQINALRAQINEQQKKLTTPSPVYNQDVRQPDFSNSGNGKDGSKDFQNRQS
jgi:hypothetical protein